MISDALSRVQQILGGFDLRNKNSVGLGCKRRGEIRSAIGRAKAIDADNHLARAEAAFRHCLANLRAGGLLRVGSNRVFEIQNQSVGRQRLCFFDGPAVRARHVEHTPARSHSHLSFYHFFYRFVFTGA